MDVLELLVSASLLVPEESATENDLTVSDIWDYLAHDEWEIALGVLEEFGDGDPLPLGFWEKLAGAAEQLGLERSADWCHWRCSEFRNGVIRADLTLLPAAEARRTTPIPGGGVLRPMWDIGHLSPAGERAVSIARLWVEDLPSLEPGGASHGAPRAPDTLSLDAHRARPADHHARGPKRGRRGGRSGGPSSCRRRAHGVRRRAHSPLRHAPAGADRWCRNPAGRSCPFLLS